MTLLLTRADVVKVLDMESTIEIVEKAFAELQRGSATMPQRTPITVPEDSGLSLFMPAFLGDMGALGAKVVSVFPKNPSEHELPTVLGVILLLDKHTGVPLVLMDGGFLTAMRTGAVSGVATRHMASPDAKVGAILGAGVQARTQVWAMCVARAFEKVLVHAIDPPAQVDAFCAEMQALHGVPFERAATAEDAVRAADVLTLATSSHEPVIARAWLKPGCHINGVGSHAPHMREIDEATVCEAHIIADQASACLAEAGDFIIPMNAGTWDPARIAGDLGAVVTGEVAGRTSAEEITLFKSVGLAIQDMSTAWAVYTRARELGVGAEFDFSA